MPAVSGVFINARHAALRRLRADAARRGCNFVSGVKLRAADFAFVQELTAIGSGCHHPALPADGAVRTSGLPEADLWALIACGRAPLGVVSRCAVFNVGALGQIASALNEMAGGEVTRYAQVKYDARKAVMSALRDDALELGADELVGCQIEVRSSTRTDAAITRRGCCTILLSIYTWS